MWLLSRGPAEPVYQGRTLSSWLDQALLINDFVSWHNVHTNATRPSATDEEALQNEARDAIRQIGTNAIPALLRKAATGDSRMTQIISGHFRGSWAERLGFGESYRRYLFRYVHEPQEALLGFEILGPTASNAVPELIFILRNNDNRNSRRAAAYSLGYIGPPARAAIPDLVHTLNDPLDIVRDPVITALFKISYDHDNGSWRPECMQVMEPALVEMLKDPQADALRIIRMLDDLGPNSRPAVPAIAPFVNSTNAQVSAAAQRALRDIDPAAAVKILTNNPVPGK